MSTASFSRRERAAIGIATLAFIGVSTIAHFALGGFASKILAIRSVAAHEQSPRPVLIDRLVRATPPPMPVPSPSPTPRSDRPTHDAHSPKPQHQQTQQTPTTPPIPDRHGNDVPLVNQHASPSPGDVIATPAPQASALPVVGEPKPATPAVFAHRVIPDYPRLCIDENATGTVTIEVTISADGSLASAWVGQTSGFPCLDEAALSAAKESTYKAPEVDGRPVAETYLILYEFAIDS